MMQISPSENRAVRRADRTSGSRDGIGGSPDLLPAADHHGVLPVRHGLYPGDEVRIAGVKVGTVTAVTPQAKQAVVTIKVDTTSGCLPTPRR